MYFNIQQIWYIFRGHTKTNPIQFSYNWCEVLLPYLFVEHIVQSKPNLEAKCTHGLRAFLQNLMESDSRTEAELV